MLIIPNSYYYYVHNPLCITYDVKKYCCLIQQECNWLMNSYWLHWFILKSSKSTRTRLAFCSSNDSLKLKPVWIEKSHKRIICNQIKNCRWSRYNEWILIINMRHCLFSADFRNFYFCCYQWFYHRNEQFVSWHVLYRWTRIVALV